MKRTWTRLIDGQCGIVSIKDRSADFALLPSQVAGLVPQGSKYDGKWDSRDHLKASVRKFSPCKTELSLTEPQDERRMARFAQYAMVASEEALHDAGWSPIKEEDLEATVWTILSLR